LVYHIMTAHKVEILFSLLVYLTNLTIQALLLVVLVHLKQKFVILTFTNTASDIPAFNLN